MHFQNIALVAVYFAHFPTTDSSMSRRAEDLKPEGESKTLPYRSGLAKDYIRSGMLGSPRDLGIKHKGVFVARGDTADNVIKSPYSEKSGIILSKWAKNFYESELKKMIFLHQVSALKWLCMRRTERVSNLYSSLAKLKINMLRST